MVTYRTISGPHTHAGDSSLTIMYLVILALLPAALYGVYLFGLPAATVLSVSCITAIVVEFLFLWWRNADIGSTWDGSALLTALILAMSLPPTTPWWIVAFGSFFAIAIGKQAYGGLGNNVFNPAMLARVMLLICFPVELTDWRAVMPPEMLENGLQFSSAWMGIDATTAATPLASLADIANSAETLTTWSLFTGQHAGSLGETSSLLLLLGGLFLLWRQVITWVIPMAVLLGLLIPAFVLNFLYPELFLSVSIHLFSGATLLIVFFIATDMVTSPTSVRGQWVFGLGCGLFIFLIRSFGNYPEGAAFSVLIMNMTTPVIDHYLRPVIFGEKGADAQRKSAQGESA
ncbi:MAG: RnfABCDGE type electron transport complex subunit D [Colwellia sp.]